MSRQSISRVSKGGSEMNIKGTPNFKLTETAFQKRKRDKDVSVKNLSNNFFKPGMTSDEPFKKT